MRARRILQESVSQPTNEVRQTPASTTFLKDRQLTSHRTTILRPSRRKNSHRDIDKGYVTVREFVLVALHGDHVTYDVATARGGLILAVRLLAVPASVPPPEIPEREKADCPTFDPTFYASKSTESDVFEATTSESKNKTSLMIDNLLNLRQESCSLPDIK
ncbi:hypothetical protein RR48_09754 [Papilio machaon]|uniref:Uncharacterized protein n=1 Tax=Papilio machaon TaxID=76193 RepID=A0A194RIR2_PAPMA|nr:hypothetical protein RR48_09754 [Papilio machaon]